MSREKITTKQILAFHWKQAMRYPKLVALTFIVAPTSIILERYITPLIIAALLLGQAVFLVALLAAAGLAWASYRVTASKDPGLTGEIALLTTVLLGGLALDRQELAAALGVMVAILLWRPQGVYPVTNR